MSAGLADALLAGLAHRAQGLVSFLGGLRAEASPADAAYLLAIDLMRDAAEATVAQAEIVLRVRDPDIAAMSLLDPLIGNLRKVQGQADLAFARGPRPHVRRSLLAAVEREIEALGVGPVRPVLTVGPPGNYETFVADLHDNLFRPISPHLQPPRGDYNVCLISVPYVEGTRALWQPLVLGHEVAHLAVHRDGTGLDTASWIADGEADPAPGQSQTDADIKLRVRLEKWVGELLCDLRSVARFGVAGLAAQADFLLAVGAKRGFETHPPGRLRIEFMLDFLDARATGTLPGPLDAVVEPWRLTPPQAGSDAGWAGLLRARLDEHREEILTAASSFPGSGRHDHAARLPAVEGHAARLASGVPGTTPVAGRPQQQEHADILTAGWVARLALTGRGGARRGEALQSDLSTLDDLVGKAVDDLHFTALWTEHGGAIGPPQDDDGAHGADPAPQASGGVLPASEIRRRLRVGAECDANDQGDALIATPLFPDSVGGASLDVHLGTHFIVFRRTATASFRSDKDDQDPRGMQELVEKDWHERFVLHPGELVLASTLEYLALPADLTAQVITRSSYGRLGLLSATAVQVQPGFRGCLTLELVNLGQMPLELTPAERIAQLVFQRVVPPAPPGAGRDKYRFPVGPEFSKVKDDPDLAVHRRIGRARGYPEPADTTTGASPGGRTTSS